MSVIRRFNKPQGLKDIDVLIEDDAPISLFFNVVEVPEVITQGKSSFLIGGSNLLKPEVEIKFEITNDDTGAVIYTEPVAGYLEGTSRRVSIEVYEDVDLFGDATLTVVGELNPNNNNVPPEFRDTYNVRYTRKLYVSSAGVNTQPILFYNQPRIVVTEIVKPYITTTFPTSSITKTGGATGTPIESEIGKTVNVEDEEPAKFVKKLKNNLRFKLFGGGGNNAFVRRGRRRARRASPEVDKFTIENTSGDKFDARFVGGEIKIPSPQVDTTKFTLEPYHQVPTEYKSDVENVKNENILVPEKPFTIIDTRFDEDDPQRNVIAPLSTENLTYTASMDSVPTQSISTVNFRSYADIRLSRLRTFSGDIDRVKVYARNKDAFGDFEIISDQQIESPELLFNVFGAGNQRIGFFLNQELINQYWVSSSNAVVSADSSYLLNAAKISGSNEGVNSFVTFEQTGSLPISFTKDTEYNISFNALGFKGDKNKVGGTERSGRLGIFLSGSGFRVNHNYGDDLGYQLEVNNQPAFLNVTAGEQEDFGQVSEVFSPQVNGNGVLKLVVFSGQFYVSDVSLVPATATGFSPNFVQIIAPVPPLTQERPDDYEFFAEFYDVNSNVAESVVFASSSTFVGGNSYIAGGDNLLSGSMFIGSAIGGGIEMAGVNSGFIRSIGYEGFTSASNPSLGSPGFLMFSGSVLPNSGDNYKGVGLELVGGANTFFRFRTDPSELDIRTDSFFIGQESIQFISGSDGNIEISSSLFHLDPKNELLVIGADAVINADLTVNNLRTPAQIGGSPSTEQNASASISSQGFAAFRSASIGGFDVDETTIASTDDSLILKSSGQITGSATLLGNKAGGNFLQFKDSTLTVQGDITANNIRTPATIGGVASTQANASASITSDGLATFKSGSIAGWKIFGNILSGSNASLDSEGAALFKSDQGPGSDTSAAFDQLRNEYYIDFTPADQGNTQNFFVKFGPNFSVDSSGTLFASGAKFEGAITASAGLIGGFTTDSSSFHSDNIFISGSPLQGGVDDPKYMFISTSNFNVKEDGSVTGSQVLFDGGKVGGWNINANQLSANNIKINAAVGYIEAGDLNNVSDYQDSSTGFFVNKDGEILLKAGTSANKNYMRFAGGTLDIRTNDFELDTNDLELSSTEASMSLGNNTKLLGNGGGSIALGSTIPTDLSSDGIMLSGSGDFNLQGDSNNFLRRVGTALTVKAETFDLDAGTIVINSAANSGKIALGSTPPTSVAYTANAGVYIDGTGDFLVRADANNFIKVYSNTLQLKTETFDLDAGTLIMDSAGAGGNGVMKLGSSASSITETANTGVYLDGNGKFRVGSATSGDNFIHFNGSQIIMKSPDFFLGDSTNFISGSNGDMQIQSGKFELDANNIEISSTHASMSLGEGKIKLVGGSTSTLTVGASNSIKLSDDGTDRFLVIGSKTSFSHFDQSTAGLILGTDNGTTKFELVGNSTNYLSFDGSNFDIKLSEGLELDASNIELSSTHASMSLGEGKIKLIGGSTSTLTVGASNSIKLSDDGTDRFLVIGSKSSFTHFDQSTAGFIVGTDGGTTKFELVGSATNYLSFDGTNFDVKLSQGLELDANNIEISSTHASMSLGSSNDINLDGVNKKITVGSANAVTIQGGSTDNFIVLGSKTSFSHFDQSTTGIIMGMDSTTPKFEIAKNSSNYFSFDGNNFDIRLSQGLELDASNIELSSTHASMSIGNTNPIILQSIGSDRVLRFGDKTDFGQTTTAGFIMGIDNGTPKLDFTVGTSNDNFFRIDSSGVSLQSDNINIDTDRFKITTNAGNERIRFFSGSDSDSGRVTGAGEFVRIGEVSDDSSDLYGLKIYDGTGTGSADTLVKLGQDGNEIAGWTITQDRLSGGQMIIRSDGTIESSGFASDVAGSGFRLTAADGGFLEVENAKIRGTMATAVFEKESVNAVGGQLYVANSTTLTGSSFPTALAGGGRTAGDYPANETTMSVENVTGFVQGEILSLKKVTDSGFSTEYVFVNSASRQDPSSDTDFSGQLYVTRGYGSGVSGDSGSLGDTPSSAQSYSGSQVIVSTGRYISGNAPNTIGSGYIRMNANPADPATPYIDIIERTGSGIYDVELKARLGDLSGLSSGLLFGETNPGFGLFTENVFLQGAITAVTGSITGKLFVDTSSSQKMIFGIGVDGGSNDGIFINANNYWYTNGEFKVGSATYNIRHDSSGNININPKTFELDATNIEISSTNASMSLGEGNILLDGTNSLIQVGKHSANHVEIKGTNTQGYIRTGKTSATDNTSGFWLANNNSDPEFSVGSATNFLKYDGGSLSIETQQLELAANTDDLQISSTQKSMSLAAGNVLLDGGGNVGYVRIGSNSTYDRNINISGSSSQAIIKAGKTSFTDTTNAGFVLEKTNTDSRFFVGDASSVNQIKFDTSGGVDIKTQKLEVDAGDIEISSTHASMSLGQGKIDLVGGSTSTITIGASNSLVLSDDGTDRFLAIGKSGFSQFDQSTEGIILGTDNGTAKFEITKNSANYLSYDGSNFDIKLSQGFELDATNLEISSTNASMSLGEGKIRAVGGSTSTITIGSSNSITLSDDGTDRFVTVGKSNFSQFDQSTEGIIFGTDNGDAKFEVAADSNNYLSFNGATNSLDIAAQTFNLNASTLKVSSNSSGSIALGASPPTTYETGTGFFVDGAGNLLLGSTSGNFIQFGASSGNLTIKSQVFSLFTSTIVIDSSVNNGKIALGATPPTAFNSGTGFYVDGTGKLLVGVHNGNRIQFDGTNIDIIAETFFIGSESTQFISGSDSNIEISSSLFHLDPKNNSLVIGADATIEADLTANNIRTPATIGGVQSTVLNASSSISSDGFAKFVSASIGGFDITSTTIAGGAVTMSSAGSIQVGTVADATTTGTTNSGFFADSSGNVLIKGNVSNNDYLKISGGGGIDIKSQVFDLDAGTIIVDSSGDGTIKLGSSASSITETANTGVFIDGGGKFRVGSATSGDNFIHFNGSQIIMKSPDFFLGDSTNHISGSGGNMNIKSVNFELDAGNLEISSANVSMSLGEGKIKLVGGSTSTITVADKFKISSDGTDEFLAIGNKTSFTHFDQSTAGLIMGMDDTTAKFEVAGDANNYLSFNGSALDIKAETFNLDANSGDLKLDSTNKKISINDATFGNTGIQLDYNGGTPRAFIGANGGNQVNFDGTNLAITSTNFSVTSGGDVSAENMTLDGEITFTTSSTVPIGTMGEITLQGTNAAGLDLGRGGASAVKGAMVIRSAAQYNQVIFEADSSRFGADSGKYTYSVNQISFGLNYINSDQGVIRYTRSTDEGLEIFTYHDSSGTPNAHTLANQNEYVRIQPEQSGSVTIMQDGAGNGIFAVGTNYGDTPFTTGNALGYDCIIDLPTYVDDNFRIDNGSLALDVANSATDGRIDAANDIVAFSTSDIRFKENVTPIQDAVSKIKTLRGVEFDWKPLTKKQKKKLHGNEGHDVGVIAQEVEKVLPEVVQTRKSGYKAVKYEKMIPLLIESIKEQQEQIEELKKEVEELKNGSTN